MAKTRAEIRTEVRQIIGQPEASNSHFTNAQLDIWINDAYRMAVAKLRVVPIKERDYGSADYSGDNNEKVALNSETMSIDLAKYKVQPDDKFVDLKIMDLQELMARDPDWESATAGKPTHLIRTGTNTALLYPPPDADNQDQTLRTYGVEVAAMTDDSESPDLPSFVHDVLPHWAAHRAFQALEQPERAGEQLIIWNGSMKSIQSLAQTFSRKKNQWRWIDSVG